MCGSFYTCRFRSAARPISHVRPPPDALTKALALPQFQALTGQMRKLTVMGGKALSAMRAALARAASD